MRRDRLAVALAALCLVAVLAVAVLDRPAGAVRVKLGASRAGSGLLLLNEATEPGVQALAGADKTSVSLQRGEQRNELVP